jgi:hypothetical protein
MGGVVCAQCARGKRKQVLRRAFAAWRKEVNPSVREIQISSQIGRA